MYKYKIFQELYGGYGRYNDSWMGYKPTYHSGGGTTLWLQCVHMLQLSGAYARTGGGYDGMMHI